MAHIADLWKGISYPTYMCAQCDSTWQSSFYIDFGASGWEYGICPNCSNMSIEGYIELSIGKGTLPKVWRLYPDLPTNTPKDNKMDGWW